jgi:hypothetical protein
MYKPPPRKCGNTNFASKATSEINSSTSLKSWYASQIKQHTIWNIAVLLVSTTVCETSQKQQGGPPRENQPIPTIGKKYSGNTSLKVYLRVILTPVYTQKTLPLIIFTTPLYQWSKKSKKGVRNPRQENWTLYRVYTSVQHLKIIGRWACVYPGKLTFVPHPARKGNAITCVLPTP